ncbi:MAG: hypothetical protein GC168_03190 [Candidatus Hydrogenedens sp.]|nr:hypothetical protein [Candidatus Hydrogenedens sp.]
MYRTLLALLLAVSFLVRPAFAAHPDTQRLSQLPVSIILTEAETGRVLYEENADQVRPPASMIKLMMMLLIAEGIESGLVQLDTPIPVTEHAQAMGGTQVQLKAGEVWPLHDMLRALAVASANDAAMAMALSLWGSEDVYRQAMNKRAAELGMEHTKFFSMHGLPPDEGDDFDWTTARDMSLLARECLKHPLIRELVSMKELKFRPTDAVKFNTNKLLWRMPGCDGMKTGYIKAAGFCVTATAERNGVRLIAVVMGDPSKYSRFNRAQEAMEQAFDSMRKVALAEPGVPLGAPVEVLAAKEPTIRLTPETAIEAELLPDEQDRVKYLWNLPETLAAPIPAGKVVGEVAAVLDGIVLGRTNLVTPTAVEREGWSLVLRQGVAMWVGLDQ